MREALDHNNDYMRDAFEHRIDHVYDAFDRKIEYMRVSITDRCNLRCRYCMPEDLPLISHNDIMRFEEILRLCAITAKIGINAIKVTGGEPLARKGCVDFIRKLKSLPGIEHVTLTTNAVLLEPYVNELAEIGLDCVNISLDSLDSDVYKRLTGRDELDNVLKSLNKALKAGLHVKINCVPLKGVNDVEIIPIAQLAERFPIDVRVIELMPTCSSEKFGRISGTEIITQLNCEYPDLIPDKTRRGFGPARYFKSGKLKGSVGIIDAVSNHFCKNCNRVRLTSEGFLKLCLFHDDGVDLRKMLRNGATDAEIVTAIVDAIYKKPERHYFDDSTGEHGGVKKMSSIGG